MDSRCCELCDKWIGQISKEKLAEANAEVYGAPIGAAYCSECVENFVENEVSDGIRCSS